MEVREELLTIAEVAIAIAGFTGVVAAFVQRGGLHAVDRVRFINVFSAAFVALVLAFVPIVVSHLGVEGERLWTRASAVMIVVWILNVGLTLRYVMPAIHAEMGAAVRVPFALVTIPSLMNFVAQVLNVAGWPWVPGFLAYLFGLFVYLYAAGLMFVYVILFRPGDSADLPSSP